MKKKALFALGLASIAIATFLSATTSNAATDVSLSGFLKINTASAECCSSPFNNGRCSAITNMCYANPGSNDCDSYAC